MKKGNNKVSESSSNDKIKKTREEIILMVKNRKYKDYETSILEELIENNIVATNKEFLDSFKRIIEGNEDYKKVTNKLCSYLCNEFDKADNKGKEEIIILFTSRTSRVFAIEGREENAYKYFTEKITDKSLDLNLRKKIMYFFIHNGSKEEFRGAMRDRLRDFVSMIEDENEDISIRRLALSVILKHYYSLDEMLKRSNKEKYTYPEKEYYPVMKKLEKYYEKLNCDFKYDGQENARTFNAYEKEGMFDEDTIDKKNKEFCLINDMKKLAFECSEQMNTLDEKSYTYHNRKENIGKTFKERLMEIYKELKALSDGKKDSFIDDFSSFFRHIMIETTDSNIEKRSMRMLYDITGHYLYVNNIQKAQENKISNQKMSSENNVKNILEEDSENDDPERTRFRKKFMEKNALESIGLFMDGIATMKKRGQYGYIDEQGNIIGATKYSEVEPFSEGLAIVKGYDEKGLRTRKGCIDKTGKEIIPLEYKEIADLKDGILAVQKDKKRGFMDKRGNRIGDIEFENVRNKTGGVILCNTGKPIRQEGVMDEKENPFGHDFSMTPDNGKRYIEEGAKAGFLNIEKKKIIYIDDCMVLYTRVEEGLIKFRGHDAICRLMDKDGNIVTKNIYHHIGDFKEGMARVNHIQGEGKEKTAKYGFINNKGEEIIGCKYDKVGDFSHGVARAIKGKQHFLIDKIGNEIEELDIDKIEKEDYEVSPVKKGEKRGLLNKEKREIYRLDSDIDEISWFYDGIAEIRKDKRYGLINAKGKEIAEMQYDSIGTFRSGIAEIQKGKKYGIINNKGEEITPIEYDEVSVNSNGIARIKKGKWGGINTKGEDIIPYKYNVHKYFKEGICSVRRDGKGGLINEKGEEITEFKYDEVGDVIEDGIIPVKIGGKMGMIDKNGKELGPIEYDKLYKFYDGKAKVEKGKEISYIFRDGTKMG